MCDIRNLLANLFCYSCSTSNINTMQPNSCKTEVGGVGVSIEIPKNTDKKVITLDNGKIKCKVCECMLPSLDHIFPHIEGKQHNNTLNQQKQEKNNLKLLENTTCSKKGKQTLSNRDIVLEKNIIDCELCQRTFDTQFNYLVHISGKSHKTQLKKYQEKHSENNLHVNNVGVDELTENIIEKLTDKTEYNHEEVQTSMYNCELCSERMNINDLFAHINIHRDNQSLNSAKDIFLYKCVCCKSIINGDTSFISHIRKETHLHNFKNFFKHIKAKNIETHTKNDSQNTLEEKNSSVFTILLPKVENTSAHFEEKCLITFNKIHYSCLVCRKQLSAQSIIIHCLTNKHRMNIKQFFSDGKVENNNDSAVLSLLNCIYNLSIIDSDNKIQSSDTSDTGLIISNAVCKQIMEKINESPLINISKTTAKCHKTKPKEIRLTDRLNKLYHMKYFQLEKNMYTLTEKTINEIKLHFQFFIQYDKHIYCMACKTKVSKYLYLLYEHTRLLSHRTNVKIATEQNTITKKYINIDKPKDEEKSTQTSNKKAAKVVATCKVCNVLIKDSNIMSHIKSIVHKQNHEKNDAFVDITVDSILKDFSDLYYSIQRFVCVECNQKIPYKMEFMEHIYKSHKYHLTFKTYTFDFCIPCATLWFSKSDSYEGHCNDIVHKYLLRSNDFMVEDLPKRIRNMLKQVDKMMNILLNETERLTEDHVEEEVRESLETKAKLRYPQAKAFLFGSRLIGLGFTNCDIDIYIDSGNKYYENNNQIEQELLNIKEAIGIDDDVWEIKEVLQTCRVPIIKLIYKPRNLDCDVSFRNGLSVEKSKLLRSFNNTCPSCKKLTLFVKKWLSFINLHGGHGFTNYALYWLVIYYLQIKKHLPSIAELIEENGSTEFIDGWQIGFALIKCKNKHEQSVKVLLQEFFEFYANFDYQCYIVCPLMGSLIAKKSFTDSQKLPKAMNTYNKHFKTSSKPEFLRIDSPLCVQDPLELCQNITKGVTSITLKYFRQYCKECAAILLKV